jgi:4-amino-4-deoxy-L-arabinose transferase-like glycosyltransferase
MVCLMRCWLEGGWPARRLALAVLLSALAGRLALAGVLDPGVDEAYAIAVSGWQLSWFDHPPMAFWWAAAMRTLLLPVFGDPAPVFMIRLPFVLMFVATSWVMFDLTRRLWGDIAGLWTLIGLSIAPFFYVSGGTWIVPDGPMLLFLAITARLVVELLFFPAAHSRQQVIWLLAGLALGLAGLSKYHALLFAIGGLGFVLATPHRRHLLTPGPWLAMAVALTVASPVLMWNAEYEWVSFRFQAGRSFGDDAPSMEGLTRAILGQMAYIGPWQFFTIAAALIGHWRLGGSWTGPSAFLLSVAAPPILLFTLLPLLDSNALPHWQMSGWMFLLPLMGRAVAERQTATGAVPREAALFARLGVAALVLAFVCLVAIRLLPPSDEVKARLGLAGFLSESARWRGLREALRDRKLLIPPQPGLGRLAQPVVATLHWIDGARVAEAIGRDVAVTVFNDDPRGFSFLLDPQQAVGQDVLILGRRDIINARLGRLERYFERIDPQPPIAITLDGHTLFEIDAAIGRRMKFTYIHPYPKRWPGHAARLEAR